MSIGERTTMRTYTNYVVLGTIVVVVAGLVGVVVTSWASHSNSPVPPGLPAVDKAKSKVARRRRQ